LSASQLFRRYLNETYAVTRRISRISAGSWSLSARSGSCRCWLCLSWREERATLAPARNHRTPRSDALTRVSRWRQVDPAATCLVTGGGREL